MCERPQPGGRWSDRRRSPTPTAAARTVGLAGFALAAATYLVGAGHSFTYDESVTVGFFVDTPSLLDPFRRQVVFNNHPLFSFIEHLVWSSGGRTETWMRLLPALFGAGAVGLLGWWLTCRRGILAGLCGAAVLGANPIFADNARTARGYSLLVLCAVASSIAMLQLVERGEQRRWSVVYVAAAAGGLATHVYMAFVVVGHVAFVVAKARPSGAWRMRWYLSALLGAVAYLGMLGHMAAAARLQGRQFRLSLPLDVARDALGTHPAAVALLAAVLGAAVWVTRLRRETVAPAIAVGAMLVTLWVVIAPFTQVRFFMWLVPGVAAGTALVVSRWPVAAVPVLAALTAMGLVQADRWPSDGRALPTAAHVVDWTRARHGEPCAMASEGLIMYTTPPRHIVDHPEAQSCDVLVAFTTWYRFDSVLDGTASTLPHVWELPDTTLVVLSRSPDLPGGAGAGLEPTTRDSLT